MMSWFYIKFLDLPEMTPLKSMRFNIVSLNQIFLQPEYDFEVPLKGSMQAKWIIECEVQQVLAQ